MNYPNLIKPLTLKDTTIPNRLVFPPIFTNYASENGEVTERFSRFYTHIASNNVGLTILGATGISPDSRVMDHAFCLYDRNAYDAYGGTCYLKRYLKEAEENLLLAVNLNERTNSLNWWVHSIFTLGQTYFEMEAYQKSQECFNKAASLHESAGYRPSTMNILKIALLKAKAKSGHADFDLGKLYKYANENKSRSFDGIIAKDVSEILLNIDNHHTSEAENWIHKAIEITKQNGMLWELGRDYALYAELFKRKGDQSKVKENLSKAIGILKECGAAGWVEKYKKELAAIS